MKTDIFRTPWGWIGIGATAHGIATIILPKLSRGAVEKELKSYLGSSSCSPSGGEGENNGAASSFLSREQSAAEHIAAARITIEAYLSGKCKAWDLTLDVDRHPQFRKKVWDVLQTIPYGRVRSYGWVARKIGKPRAARAVGAACGANPVPLVVPCHRVVAGDGSLGGFSGGLPVKKRLLRLEGILQK
jgi:methylated-DNA-[protein]-cysteine S-methyltransferase